MMKIIAKLYRILVQIFCIPIFLGDFFSKETGKEYQVSFWTKLSLVIKMILNNGRIVSGSSFIEHLAIATAILNTPKALEGVVVECGTYKGVSATNLSLICALCNRTLEIFDSFEGLPEPHAEDKEHALMSSKERHTYTKGSWCGTLEEVKENIKRYGRIEVCRFNKGYFENTLPHFNKKCILVWVDVDYRTSLETCVKYLWPLLQNDCFFFSHEVGHMEIASLFFSEKWWKDNLNSAPPGLIGAGTGIGIKILTGSYFNSSLGYTIKNPTKTNYVEVPQLGGLKLNLKSSFQLASSGEARSKNETKKASSQSKDYASAASHDN